ncbi:MAG: type III pantothenate kinase [Chitinophagaceae bacterium]|jgi:type III pantothenate kinase|nr:type III pantothenate kinase [Chitinophagaceae bacterium]
MAITTLCFDFGNTRLKYGVFEGKNFVEEVFLENDSVESITEALTKYNPQKTILSSVINHNPQIETLLAQQSKFHLVGADSKMPIIVPTGNARSIGADRLALLMGAINEAPHKHNLIIGLGSCITYNFINKFNQFLGGSISPGLQMRFKSMHDFTAKLPLQTPDWNFPLVGYDTRTNLLSGVILGMSLEIDGVVNAYAEKYSKFNVFMTGGDMKFFLPQLKNQIIADANLLYKGLYAFSELNN